MIGPFKSYEFVVQKDQKKLRFRKKNDPLKAIDSVVSATVSVSRGFRPEYKFPLNPELSRNNKFSTRVSGPDRLGREKLGRLPSSGVG